MSTSTLVRLVIVLAPLDAALLITALSHRITALVVVLCFAAWVGTKVRLRECVSRHMSS